MQDRFLYVKMKARLAACQPNLSPANYNHHDAFRKMTQIPCTSVIVSLPHSHHKRLTVNAIMTIETFEHQKGRLAQL